MCIILKKLTKITYSKFVLTHCFVNNQKFQIFYRIYLWNVCLRGNIS